MFWYQGQLIEGNTLEIGINEPGLLYGATIFTTLRVYQNSLNHPLTNWQAHCDRIKTTVQDFGWQQPDWQRITAGAKALLTEHPVLRITVFPDGKELILGRLLPQDLASRQQQGITAWLAQTDTFRRHLPNHKTGNYLGAWLALQQAQKLGTQEAILLDDEENWLETSTGNLWGWYDGCWWTPPLTVGILGGTVRSQLLKWLQKQGICVQQQAWTTNFVQKLEFVAYTNAVMQIIPIHTIISTQKTYQYSIQSHLLEQLSNFFIIEEIQ